MIHDGLEHLHRGSRLGDQITAERDHLDGAPSASDIRRAAPRRAQLRSLGRAPQHDLRVAGSMPGFSQAVPVGWIENDGHPVVDGLGFIYGLASSVGDLWCDRSPCVARREAEGGGCAGRGSK